VKIILSKILSAYSFFALPFLHKKAAGNQAGGAKSNGNIL